MKKADMTRLEVEASSFLFGYGARPTCIFKSFLYTPLQLLCLRLMNL